jgi:hypothetical protein
VRAIVLFIFGVIVVPTLGQTVAELQQRYGNALSVYAVSEHIWMTPDYSTDGQVCRMRLYPRRLGVETDYLIKQLPFTELTQLLNEIVPPHRRGSKKDGFGMTSLGGGTAWTTYNYENVSFAFIFSYKPDADAIRNAKPLTGPDPENLPQRKKTPPSMADFANSQKLETQIVTITWNHRSCVPGTVKRVY